MRELATPVTVTIQDKSARVVWSHTDGFGANGLTSMAYLTDGTQQCIIDALLSALIEARGQLRSALQVTNVVPYVRPPAAEVDNGVPVI